MRKLFIAYVLTLGLAAGAASANDDGRAGKRNYAQASQYDGMRGEFSADFSPALNIRASQTGRLFAADVNPALNVGQGGALFAADFDPALNFSYARTRGLFDINPHLNVR